MKRLITPSMWLLCCLICPWVNATQPESAGISFYVLRVIYPESANKGVTLTIHNKSAAPYLMQSWVRPVDQRTGDVELSPSRQTKAPFIVTPPLERLEAEGELTLRIRRNGDVLPSDRESVFFISMKAIPASRKTVPAQRFGQMAITVVSNMKLFYRPDGLSKRAIADVAPELRFRRAGNELIAENPTPYWLTFSRLKVGTTVLDKLALRLMVPPKGQQRYPLPATAEGNVEWQLIDEDGWDTLISQQAL
ncbi:TPA: molecular chaperone [Serratia fonticola]